jgi:hypothetical protein
LNALDTKQLENLVYRAKNKAFGQNWENYIYDPSIYFIDNKTPQRPFLQFDSKFQNMQANNEKKQSRIMGWAHPDNIDLLFKEKHAKLFIDCTFKACPEEFGQLMIVMTYAEKYDYYAPVFYVLLEDKTEKTYNQAIAAVKKAVGIDFEVDTATCDFEIALIKAIKGNFPECKMVLCLFHLKQAIRRWIKEKTNMSKEGIRRLLGRRVTPEERLYLEDEYYERGLIELLTVIPLNEVKTFGIPYIREQMKDEEDLNKIAYDLFWEYFDKQWLQKKTNTDWNLADIRKSMHLANRTNNPLERYNRTLNELIKHATKIQLPQLISIFLEDSKRIVEEIQKKN